MDIRHVIVLDTHVLIWAVQDDARLKQRARQRLQHSSESGRVLVSVIVATARFHRRPLMTADNAILAYGEKGYVEVIPATD